MTKKRADDFSGLFRSGRKMERGGRGHIIMKQRNAQKCKPRHLGRTPSGYKATNSIRWMPLIRCVSAGCAQERTANKVWTRYDEDDMVCDSSRRVLLPSAEDRSLIGSIVSFSLVSQIKGASKPPLKSAAKRILEHSTIMIPRSSESGCGSTFSHGTGAVC